MSRCLLLLVCCFIASVPTKAQNLPDLAVIKAAAEQGDAQAQNKLGNAYYSFLNFSEAARWYRLAAERGIANAQCRLGEIYLNGKPAIGVGSVKVPEDLPAAMQWLHKAANQDHEQAQVQLGACFRDGHGVKADYVEAYKWYSLAARKSWAWGRAYRDPLILKMTSAQVQEGQRRLEAFRPSSNPAPLKLSNPLASQIELKGISGPKDRRLAVINNETFGVGEERTIKLGKQSLRIKCYEIREKMAVVGIPEAGERWELSLP